jgi:hypothetical protein
MLYMILFFNLVAAILRRKIKETISLCRIAHPQIIDMPNTPVILNLSTIIPSAGGRRFPSFALFAAFLSFALFAATAVQAQTVDEIVARYVSALGGKEKLQSIKSVYQEGVAVMQNGTEIDSKSWKVQGKLYRTEISFGMGSVVVIITPSGGWSSNPRSGGEFKEMTADQVKKLQWQLDCTSPLVDYAAKGNKVELTGSDTVNGNECYKLRLTFPSGEYITYAIDKKTGYELRESRKTGSALGGGAGGGGRNADAEFKIEFSDYQKTPDGYMFPFTIVAGGFGAKTSIEKLEVNKPVDVATLSKPSN